MLLPYSLYYCCGPFIKGNVDNNVELSHSQPHHTIYCTCCFMLISAVDLNDVLLIMTNLVFFS